MCSSSSVFVVVDDVVFVAVAVAVEFFAFVVVAVNQLLIRILGWNKEEK